MKREVLNVINNQKTICDDKMLIRNNWIAILGIKKKTIITILN